MNLLKHNKGELVSIITLVLIVLILIGYGIKMSGRQCTSNSECKDTQYCGSDYKCHDMQIVKVYKHDLLMPSIILAVAIVVGAVIMKKKKEERVKYINNKELISIDYI